jgi:hypothetical protein
LALYTLSSCAIQQQYGDLYGFPPVGWDLSLVCGFLLVVGVFILDLRVYGKFLSLYRRGFFIAWLQFLSNPKVINNK